MLLALCGCSSVFGLHEPRIGDGATDTPSDARQCFGAGAFTACLDALPIAAVTLPSAIDTVMSPLCSSLVQWTQTQPETCFILGTDITQSGTTVVTGARPLVLLATGTLAIGGLLDASSHIGGTAGPAASSSECGAFGRAAQDSTNGGGGGAGGSFMTRGGDGGLGGAGLAMGGEPNVPLTAPGEVLRGGCAGERGGQSQGSTGIPGAGGGALALISGTRIRLTGAQVAVSGAGAQAGSDREGGSGGGSGGMLVLWAPMIEAATTARLSANGGGGASGATGQAGANGADPDPSQPTLPAAGGAVNAGVGGSGYAGGSPPGSGASGGSSPGGGGGGGGGAGYIRANVAVTGVTSSPAIDVIP